MPRDSITGASGTWESSTALSPRFRLRIASSALIAVDISLFPTSLSSGLDFPYLTWPADSCLREVSGFGLGAVLIAPGTDIIRFGPQR